MFFLEYRLHDAWVILNSGDHVIAPGEELEIRARPITSEWLDELQGVVENSQDFQEFRLKWREAAESLMGTTKQSVVAIDVNC